MSPGEGRVGSASCGHCGHGTRRSRAGSEVLAHAPPGGRFLWPQGVQGPAGRGNLAAPSSYRERSGIPEALPARGPGEPVQSWTGPDPLPSASAHPTPRSQGLIKPSSPGTPLHPTLLGGYLGRERPKGLIWTREWKPREGWHPDLWQERMLPGACSGPGQLQARRAADPEELAHPPPTQGGQATVSVTTVCVCLSPALGPPLWVVKAPTPRPRQLHRAAASMRCGVGCPQLRFSRGSGTPRDWSPPPRADKGVPGSQVLRLGAPVHGLPGLSPEGWKPVPSLTFTVRPPGFQARHEAQRSECLPVGRWNGRGTGPGCVPLHSA